MRKLMTALAAAALTVLPVAGAQAATASHTMSKSSGAVIYETNKIYTGATFVAPTGTPSTGVISNVAGSVEWVFSPRTDMVTKLCANTLPAKCTSIPLYQNKSFTTTVFNGLPATMSFYYTFQIPTSQPNKVLANEEYVGKNSVTVTYNTP